ncbi:CPBP family intramembrane glutamic endopeptidase [Rhodopirellula sallentina]|uniref:Putative membrane protein n=1 Tax=Rhodopirellula sallentina SM41 TaxID=1263870 RepID=M5TXZ4_9BACT|nr:CPBP family intramembrane glutamic endopeptidase [Rhodopirellula sallentina]EMI53894.1 putative membrane protein [Rhodopirellula sallentina SM41]
MDDEPQTPETLFHTAVGVEGGLGVLAILLGYFFGPDARELVPSLDQLPAVFGGIGLGILATFPLLLLMGIIRRIKHPAVEQLDQLSEHPMIELMLKLGPAELLVISLCAGVGEELLFRGWLMPALAQLLHGEPISLLGGDPAIIRPWWAFGGWTSEIANRAGEQPSAIFESGALSWSALTQWWSESIGWEMTVAWLLSSISFGFVHPISKLYIGVTALMGLYFGALLILTGNLMIPIIAHALYDAIQLWSASAEEASKQAKSA